MLEAIYAKAAVGVIGTLLNFIGVHTPDRVEPLSWPEATSNVPGMAAAGDVDARLMIVADRLIAAYGPDADCDQWCLNVALAQDAWARGDNLEVVRLAFEAYGIEGQAAHGARTITCESGFNPLANNGWHKGWGQQDPSYWPGRSAAAGFPGWSIYDPVAQAFTMAWMVRYGGGWGHWECA